MSKRDDELGFVNKPHSEYQELVTLLNTLRRMKEGKKYINLLKVIGNLLGENSEYSPGGAVLTREYRLQNLYVRVDYREKNHE